MKIETEHLEDHQVKLTVEIEPERMNSSKQKAARKIARRLKIPGFRPGKAPYPVILRYAGEAAIVEEAIDLLVSDIYPDLIEEENIQPYGPGTLENIVSIDPPVLEFVIPLVAEVELGDYKEIRKEYSRKNITEEEVDEVITGLREQQATIAPVDRASEIGDLVTVRFSGVEVKSETADSDLFQYPARSIPFLVRAKEDDSEENWPYPGFTKSLIGMNEGEDLEITHTFPDDAMDETFAGKVMKFDLHIEDVKERTLPELDETFAKSVGDFDSIEDLKQEIHDSLDRQSENTYREEYDEEILEELITASKVNYPPQMLNMQIENMIENMSASLEQQNLDLDLYLKTRQMTLDELKDDTKPVAEKRLKKTLVLMDIASTEDIQISTEELQHEIENALDSLFPLNNEGKRDTPSGEDLANISNNVLASMLANRAMDRFRDLAMGIVDETAPENDSEDYASENEDSGESSSEGENLLDSVVEDDTIQNSNELKNEEANNT